APPAIMVAHAEARRPLGARVRRRHRDDREPGLGRDRLRKVDGAPASEGEQRIRAFRRLGRFVDTGRGNLRPAPYDLDRRLPARARDEEGPLATDLVQQLRELCEPPANLHTRSRANATNASATRVATRPAARTSEISRDGSSPRPWPTR